MRLSSGRNGKPPYWRCAMRIKVNNMSDKIYIHVRGHDDVYARGVEIAGVYTPKQFPWIHGDTEDSQFELSGVFATDSSVNLMDSPGVAEWAEQEAIKRIEGKK